MGIIIFNVVGIVIVAASFGAAFLLGRVCGFEGEGPLMIVSGPLITVADVLYRRRFGTLQWFNVNDGGMFFFLPLWLVGFMWLVLGVFYTLGIAE